MKAFIPAVAVALSIACASTPSQPFDCLTPPAFKAIVEVENPVEGEFIIVLKPGSGAASLNVEAAAQALAQQYDLKDVLTFKVIQGFVAKMDLSVALRIAANPRILFIQQNGIMTVNTPWGLDRIDQRDLPLDGVYSQGVSTERVHAYVLDTGIYEHEDFADRLGQCHSVYPGDCKDDHGHGTHVAGTIGGTKYGVAKEVTLHAVKVLSNGSGTDAKVIEGIDWVTEHVRANRWPAVANMSLGGSASPALDLAVCNSIATGITYVVAAGNESTDACSKSPARVVQAVSTGACDKSDRGASWSNTGQCVDVVAPGVDIDSARKGGGSTLMSGTSMASPHAAGVAALCLARGLDPKECIISTSSKDKLSNIGSSPNRLLYAKEQ